MMAGRLSDLLVFEARTVTVVNEQNVISWTTGFTIKGEAQRSSETLARFIIRYRPGIGPDTHRIIWDGAIFNITSAVHNRKRTMLTIDCDFSMMVEVTHLQSTEREYIDGLPVVRPTE